MKKIVKFIILGVFVMLCMCAFGNKTEATTLDLDYSLSNGTEENSSSKINAGDEIEVSLTINSSEDEKIMALYGTVEYNENVLELIKEENSENSAEIDLGTGWTIGNLSIPGADEENTDENTSQLLVYSNDESRENTAVYIRFKVKDNVDTKQVKNTDVTIKNIKLYDSEHKETEEKIDDTTLTVNFSKIGKVSKTDRLVMIIAIIVICIILLIIIAGIKRNKKQERARKATSKNSEVSMKTNRKIEPKAAIKDDNIEATENKDDSAKEEEKVEEQDDSVKEEEKVEEQDDSVKEEEKNENQDESENKEN